MSNYRLTLYIAGLSSRSERAIKSLRLIGQESLLDQYELAIVDILEQPEAAEENNILATPTLIREAPPPVRRIIGDLSNPEDLRSELSINPLNAERLLK